MLYQCCDQQRREAVLSLHTWKGVDFNGIDYLNTADAYTLELHFIHPLVTERSKKLQTDVLKKEDVSITGGERIRNITISETHIDEQTNILTVKVNQSGDRSTYTLSLKPDPHLLLLDPLLAQVDFNFASSDKHDIDCESTQSCKPELTPTPDIDYMAKDFTSFRQLMLDRMAFLVPDWKERSAADLNVMLIELLAYVGDQLSYRQDVIATESYLSTARRRISVRRHARLLDYYISDGCNARAWVQVRVNTDIVRPDDDSPAPLPKGTQLLTRVSSLNDTLVPETSLAYKQIWRNPTTPEVFETIYDANSLFVEHNELRFYTWGARNCCLPRGTTRATLRGNLEHLQPGDVLIFKEVLGTHSGTPEDAEPTHRHAVRLTSVTFTQDPLGAWYTHTPGKDQHEGDAEETLTTTQERIDERTTVVEEGDVAYTESAIEQIATKDEKSRIEGGQVVSEPVSEHYTLTEDNEALAEEDSITEKLPRITLHLESEHAEQPRQKRRKAKRGHREHEEEVDVKEEVFEDEISDDTITQEDDDGEDITEQRNVETKTTRTVTTTRIEVDGKELEEVDVLTDTITTTQEDVKRKQDRDASIEVTEIEWSYEDALPFPLCISATTDYAHGHKYIEDVSIALGNIVLADHGRTLPNELLIPVPPTTTLQVGSNSHCEESQVHSISARFYPKLNSTSLTYASPYDDSNSSASDLMQLSSHPHMSAPAIRLKTSSLHMLEAAQDEQDTLNASVEYWLPQRDLLDSTAVDRHFVVENESDGTSYLRFGDDRYGRRPPANTQFTATYRIGNGVSGNIGADTLYHIVSSDDRIDSISNPIPALGGTRPESIEDVRQKLSRAFLTQERGVTPEDYKEIAERHPEVQTANAFLQWTGSWYTLFLVIERIGGMPVDKTFKREIRRYMEPYRMAGADLVVVSPVYVYLEIAMTVTIQPDYFRDNIKTTLLEIFSNRQWVDGQRGIFYPDNFAFGQTVYLNPLYVAPTNVPGVATVNITTFQRQGIPGTGLQDGALTMNWREMARLENNPHVPEHGLFLLTVRDGK